MLARSNCSPWRRDGNVGIQTWDQGALRDMITMLSSLGHPVTQAEIAEFRAGRTEPATNCSALAGSASTMMRTSCAVGSPA